MRPENALLVNQKLFKLIHVQRMGELALLAKDFKPVKEECSETRTLYCDHSVTQESTMGEHSQYEFIVPIPKDPDTSVFMVMKSQENMSAEHRTEVSSQI